MRERETETAALQLRPEDDGEHGEADRHGQTQIQVQQEGAEEGDQPHQLGGSRGQSVGGFTPAVRLPGLNHWSVSLDESLQ